LEAEDIFGKSVLSEHELLSCSISTLAWVGDAVFELYVRTKLSGEFNAASGQLHRLAEKYVSAEGQANLAGKLSDANSLFSLEENERNLLKRARNFHASSLPRHAAPSDYRKATAIEALIGWLWLQGKKERTCALISYLLDSPEDPIEDHE
jgi:ribonuclease-3 family protein